MKLNPDCIRAILLTVEDACSIEQTIILPQDRGDYLKPYFDEEILYHVRQCNLSGLLYKATAVSGAGKTNYIIMDLSPAGHAFLANVRKDTIWNNTKSIAAKIGSKSLDALIQISSNVISDLIKAQFSSPFNPSSPNM